MQWVSRAETGQTCCVRISESSLVVICNMYTMYRKTCNTDPIKKIVCREKRRQGKGAHVCIYIVILRPDTSAEGEARNQRPSDLPLILDLHTFKPARRSAHRRSKRLRPPAVRTPPPLHNNTTPLVTRYYGSKLVTHVLWSSHESYS